MSPASAEQEAAAAANERIRVCDVVPIWWQRKVSIRGLDTQSSYRSYLKTLERSPLWSMSLSDIKHRHIMAWQETVRDTPSAANQALALLKLISKFALLEDWITHDPTDKHPKLPQDEPNQPIISTDDRRALRAAVEADSNPAKWALLLQIVTGCRTIDACKIETTDIDAGERLWTIPASKFKTKRKHTYPLDAETTIIAQNAAQWTAGLRAKRNAVKRFYKSLIKELGITDLGPHALRRLMASDIAEHEGLVAAQLHLGHASSTTTERSYIKSRDPRRRAVAEAVAQRLKSKG